MIKKGGMQDEKRERKTKIQRGGPSAYPAVHDGGMDAHWMWK